MLIMNYVVVGYDNNHNKIGQRLGGDLGSWDDLLKHGNELRSQGAKCLSMFVVFSDSPQEVEVSIPK
jgi:hypothetical protein